VEGGGAGGGRVGAVVGRCLMVDMDLGRDEDDEDDGLEFETTGERVIDDAVIEREEDDPASKD
jgi:hypothetical protein